MKTTGPADTIARFGEAMNRGDLDSVLSLYEPGATLVVSPGTVATGTAALREALGRFLGLKPTLTTEAYEVVESGDVALYCARWKLRGTDPDGKPVQMGGRSTDVLRRQSDGRWLLVLDNPWGTDVVA